MDETQKPDLRNNKISKNIVKSQKSFSLPKTGKLIRSIPILNTLIVIIILVFLFGLAYVSVANNDIDMKVYINAESDLPDDSLLLTNIMPENTSALRFIDDNMVHKLERDEEYDVVFSIQNGQKTQDYKIIVDSKIFNKVFELTLQPEEKKTYSLKVKTQDEHTWVLQDLATNDIYNKIDITENSWLAKRQDLEVRVDKTSVPLVVSGNYNLPISTYMKGIGEIYHMNITFDELLEEPFERELTQEILELPIKEIKTDNLKMYVEDNHLILERFETHEIYSLKTDEFSIKVVDNGPDGMDRVIKELKF
jgi:hypothetical protein